MREHPWRWPLFLFYLAIYSAFVLINAATPEVMDRVVFAGLNLAVVYGFALILAAIVLAGIYGLTGPSADGATAGEGATPGEGAAVDREVRR